MSIQSTATFFDPELDWERLIDTHRANAKQIKQIAVFSFIVAMFGFVLSVIRDWRFDTHPIATNKLMKKTIMQENLMNSSSLLLA
jgi:hypothetical protein